MNLNSVIIKGKFFIGLKKEELINGLKRVRNMIINFLKSEGYEYEHHLLPFFCNSLAIDFILRSLYENNLSKLDKIKKFLRILSDTEVAHKTYFRNLKLTKSSTPVRVIVYIYLGKYKGTDGIIVEITSIPAIYLKITQGLLPYSTILSEAEYSAIVFENKEFVERIARAIHGSVIERPKPLLEYFKTEVTKKLETFGLEKIAKMLEESKTKIETGRIKEGLDEMRGAVENFLYELVLKTDRKPKSQSQPEKNLELLEKMGYLDGETKGLLYSCLINGVYSFLSKKHHERETTDLFTARLCFNLIEEIFDTLVEKVIRYQIKTKKEGAP